MPEYPDEQLQSLIQAWKEADERAGAPGLSAEERTIHLDEARVRYAMLEEYRRKNGYEVDEISR